MYILRPGSVRYRCACGYRINCSDTSSTGKRYLPRRLTDKYIGLSHGNCFRYDQAMQVQKNRKQVSAEKVVLVSFLVDLFDVVSNLVVAVLTGSATIYSEMAQGIADSIGSVFLVIGERRSRRPADGNHPLGYARETFFWSLMSAVVMLVVGGGLSLWRGYQQLVDPQPVQSPILALAVIGLAVVTNGYAVSLSMRRIVEKLGSLRAIFTNFSQPLVKGAFLRDTVGTATSVLGMISLLLYAATGLLVFDAIGAIIAAIFMIGGSLTLINQARALIAGQSLSASELNLLKEAILHDGNVDRVNHLVAIYAGASEILVETDLDVSEKLTTSEIEVLLDSLEERMRQVIPDINRVRVLLNSP